MYCPQCSSTNEDGAAFCAACGTDLRKYNEQWWNPDLDPANTAAAVGAANADATDVPPEGNRAPEPAPQGAPAAGASTSPPPYQPQYQPGYQSPPPYQTQPPYQQAPGYQQGGYYPPGQPQVPGYPPGYGPGGAPHVPSYLGWAIATIFAFWPTAIVAIVYATKVSNLLSIGDVWGARESSRKAKIWCWISFGIGVAWWVFWVLIVLAAVVWSGTYIDNSTF